jgi:ABC-type polar amino acid transport system ATPase subunit
MSIALDQVTKRYQSLPVVNDVSLEIGDGELLVLLGPSGGGKSTLRDFLVLHYQLSQPGASEFWRYCHSMSTPERLQHKLNVYRARGHLVKYQ